MVRRPFLTTRRFTEFLWFSVTSIRDFRLRVAPEEGGVPNYRSRADWTRRHARRLCRIMGWTVEAVGTPPPAALYGSNHLGYTDIVMIAATTPVVFVAKSEVRSWPILGSLAGCAGTLFLRRDRKEDLLAVGQQFDPIVAAGIPVVIFLEGTSSNGDRVLPFRPSLLAPAVTGNWPVAPVGIDYAVTPGSVALDVAWWGDMEFFPHFLNLMGRDAVHARVAFGRAREAGRDRKTLARELHAEVLALRRPLAHVSDPLAERGLAPQSRNP